MVKQSKPNYEKFQQQSDEQARHPNQQPWLVLQQVYYSVLGHTDPLSYFPKHTHANLTKKQIKANKVHVNYQVVSECSH